MGKEMLTERSLKINKHLFEELYEEIKEKLEFYANKYEPKQYINTVLIKDSEDDEENVEERMNEYCDDCIEKAKKRTKKEKGNKNKFIDSEYYTACCSERSTFQHCDECGEIFDYAYYLCEDEVGHWVDKKTEVDITDPREAWMLKEIFEKDYITYGYRSEEQKINSDAQKYADYIIIAEKIKRSIKKLKVNA